MEIKVKGIELYDCDMRTDKPFTIIAHGAVVVGDIIFNNIALTWSEDGVRAMAPGARTHTGAYAVHWPVHGETAREIADKMFAMFKRMGGKVPATKRQFVPFNELDLPDDATREDVVAALDRLSEERGVTCFTGTFEKPPVVERPDVHCFLSTDEDDAAGLRRALRAEDEACERAGL